MTELLSEDAELIEGAPEKNHHQALVDRIQASACFSKALQLRSILAYICHRAFVDNVSALREHEIAISALGRRGDFDPTADTIVRVQVAHLRKRLEQYFSTEGLQETVILTIPKGSYIPRFENRSIPHLEQLPSAPAHLVEPAVSPSVNRLWIFSAAAVVLIVIAAVVVMRLKAPIHAGTAGVDPADDNIFTQHVFAYDAPVSVIAADTNLLLLQQTLHSDVSTSDYASTKYPDNLINSTSDPQLRDVLKVETVSRYTSYGDVNIAIACESAAALHRSHMLLRYARFINIRDFESGNFVLIGSRRSDPWVGLFEPKLNFVLEEDPVQHVFHFKNKLPRPGEQDTYNTVGNWSGESTSYVELAMVSNLTKTGYVLLLGGIGMEGTEAAAQFVFGKESSKAIQNALGTKPIDLTQPVEVLLRVRSVQGTASGIDIVATRAVGM